MIIFLFIYFSRQDDIGDINILNPNTPIQMQYDTWVECQQEKKKITPINLTQSDYEYYFPVSKNKGICQNGSMLLQPNIYIVYLVFKQPYPGMKVYLDSRQFYIQNKSDKATICPIVFYHDNSNFTLDIDPDEQADFQFYLIGQSPNLYKLKFGFQNLTANVLISSNIDQLYLKSQNITFLDSQTLEVQDNYVVQTNCTGGLQFFVSVKNLINPSQYDSITSYLFQGEIQQILILKYNLTINSSNSIKTLDTQTKITLLKNSLFKYTNESQYPLIINSSRSILKCDKQYMSEDQGYYPIKLIKNETSFSFEQDNTLLIIIQLIYQNDNDISYQELKNCFNEGINLNIQTLQINNYLINKELLSKDNSSLNQDNLAITLKIQYQVKSNVTLSMEGTINFTNPKQLYYEFDISDKYIYDTPDRSPNLIFLILIAGLPWFIGIIFIIIYLRIIHFCGDAQNRELIELRNWELE